MVTRLTGLALPGGQLATATNTYEADVTGIGLNGSIAGDRVTLHTGATNTAYGYVVAETPTANYLNVLFWFDPNGVTISTSILIMSVYDTGNDEMARLEMRYSSGYQVRMLAEDTGGGLAEVATWQAISDGEHSCRLVLTRAAALPGADGEALWELDGVEVATKTNCDPFTVNWGEVQYGLTGMDGAGGEGVYYIDLLTVGYTADPVAPPTPTPSALSTPDGRVKMIRIVQGFDPANPTDYIEFNGTSGNFYVVRENSAISAGQINSVYSGLRPDRDGERLVSESRSNAKFQLHYNAQGTNVVELGRVQTRLSRMLNNAANYETKGQGEPVWLEYRWDDGLNVQPPAWGQLNHYLRIIRGSVPKWPDDINQTVVVSVADDVVAEFTCEPMPRGLERWAGRASSGVDMHPWGLMCGLALDNFVANPSFAHTTWSTGWSVSAATLIAHQSTDIYYSRQSAAYLTNADSGGRAFQIGANLDADTFTLSFKAKSPIGTAITSAITQARANGVTLTTAYQLLDDGWYLCSGEFTLGSPNASCPVGCIVAAGQSVVVDDFMVNYAADDVIYPFCSGDSPGRYWTGARNASASTYHTGGGFAAFDFTDALSGVFTLAGWVTPHWLTPMTTAGDIEFFRYISNSDALILSLDRVNETYTLAKTVNSTPYTDDVAIGDSYAFGTPVHLAIVQTDTQMILYQNGVSILTVNAPGTLAGDGVFNLGYGTTAAAFDGWRCWKQLHTASQVLQRYNVESVTKAAGQVVGIPPVLVLAVNGASFEVDNYLLANTQENHGVLLGVNGSAPARLKVYLDSSQDIPGTVDYPTDIVVGRQALAENIHPVGLGVNDLSGVSNAYSVDGAYYSAGVVSVGAGSAYSSLGAFTVTERLNGSYILVGRYACDSTDVTIAPYFHYGADSGGDYAVGKAVQSHGSGTILRYVNFGPLPKLAHPAEDKPPITFGLRITNNGAGSATVLLDYLQLVPAPFVHLKAGATSGDIKLNDTVVIDWDYLETVDTAGNRSGRLYNQSGHQLSALPGHYNVLTFFVWNEGISLATVTDITRTMQPRVKVTPRFELPGGPIA